MNTIYTCFPGGKHKVLTLSYDDGRLEDRHLVEILNRHGIKATFHLNSGLCENPDRIPQSEWPSLYEGHEVACHTVTHPTIARCPIEHTAMQVLEDRRNLEAVMHYPVRGMSYPNGSYNDQITTLLPGLGIEYCRVVGNTDSFEMPQNYLLWKATCHHNHNLLENAERFVGLFKTQYLYLMYVWGHSYEFTADGNWDLMETFCEKVGNREDTWYATNIQIVDYMKAAERLQCTVDGDVVYNPNQCSIWLNVNGEGKEIRGGQTLNRYKM